MPATHRVSRPAVRLSAVLAVIVLAALPGPAQAQLVSPGKLSAVHASLEGVGSCTKCHNFGAATFRENCLACHAEIRTRVERGIGYHAFTRKLECASCHKEHHGRDFQLIRWDPASFDHRQAGLPLQGAHARLACRRCHSEKNFVQKEIRGKSAEAKRRTFLGLEPACGNCHPDEHRGQLGTDCARCHGFDAWKTVSFSHTATHFPLDGRHADVPCAKCHPAQRDPRADAAHATFLKFRGIAFRGCLDCHDDTHHRGAFGTACANCHTPADWKSVRVSASAGFDHAKTHFPLEGRHRDLACAKCHRGGTFGGFAGKDLARCASCHPDEHRGQFAHRRDGGECAACHAVAGFSPARFDATQHADTRFPLTGAHVAVACDRCHSETTLDGAKTARFHWDTFACTDCHRDPHAGQFTDRVAHGGCTACHATGSWQAMEFDHARTSFPLRGKHVAVPCSGCHVPGTVGGVPTVVYALGAATCDSCHRDPHRGQFAENGSTACARCHVPERWSAVTFDHATARFPLTGKHVGLPCGGCHKPVALGDTTLVRYKPMDTACSACHPGG